MKKKEKNTVEFHNKNCVNASEKTALRLYIRRVYFAPCQHNSRDSCLFYSYAKGFGCAVKSLYGKHALRHTNTHTHARTMMSV